MNANAKQKMASKAYAHQDASIEFFKEQPFGMDLSDPGTGKTFVQIKVFEEFRNSTPGAKLLVLAPKSLLEAAWANDIKKFAPTLKVSIATAKNRAEAFNAPADVYITNHDAIKWLEKNPRVLDGITTLVVDESTAFKHPTSQRSKALAKLAPQFTEGRRLLTGTPIANGVLDIWHQMKVVDLGQRLGKQYFAFRSSVCSPVPRGGFTLWEEKEGAADAVAGLLTDCTIRHSADECLDLPENHEYEISFKPSAKVALAYKQMKDIQLSLVDGGVINAVNAASAYSKLLQILSGAVYDENKETISIDNQRAELIADLIEARSAKHSVVFFQWTHQRDTILEELRNRKISVDFIDGSVNNRSEIVDRFQNGELQALLIHPQAGGHGLTLTKGTTTIWASPTTNLEWYIQGNRRIYRNGQTQKCETIIVVAEGTMEVDLMTKLQEKDDKQALLLEFLQE